MWFQVVVFLVVVAPQDVWHNPSDEGKGRLWYGSPSVVDAWEGYLVDNIAS